MRYLFMLLILVGQYSDAVWLPFNKKNESNDKPLVVLQKNDDRKTIRTMSFAELEKHKNIRLADGKIDMAIKYLETMIPLCDDLQKLNLIILEVADLLFESENFKQAETYYREFCTLYPGDQQIEYALYKAILCSFNMILIPDRDQSKTHQTIELVESFLNRKEIFTSHIEKVLEIKRACYARLIESELSITRIYAKRGKHVAAQGRIDHIGSNLLEVVPVFEELVLQVQNELLAQQGFELLSSLTCTKNG